MRAADRTHLDWSISEERHGLPCAYCQQAMSPLLLFAVPVDRCTQHGVWFDHGELAAVLERSAAAVVVAGAAVAAPPSSVAGETAGALDALGVVVEVTLQVIGGILSAIDF